MPGSKRYRHRKLASAKACAVGSFRRVKSGKALVTVCCPRGKWDAKAKRCRVGMRGVGVDVPRFNGVTTPNAVAAMLRRRRR